MSWDNAVSADIRAQARVPTPEVLVVLLQTTSWLVLPSDNIELAAAIHPSVAPKQACLNGIIATLHVDAKRFAFVRPLLLLPSGLPGRPPADNS